MPTPETLLIFGGRVIDPAVGRDAALNVLIRGRLISELTPHMPSADRTLDATGHFVVPGLIDMHVHLREPGGEPKETIASGTAAAVAGGFTAVACMPNTAPAMDSAAAIQDLRERIHRDAHCRVYPIATLTRDRTGVLLADFDALVGAGAVAFSDDGDGLNDSLLMAEAMGRLGRLGRVTIQHCEDGAFPRGVIHDGDVARELGLPGISPLSEELMIARDLVLSEALQARYHVAHISTARAVEMVRRAKQCDVPVTTEVCPHHLLLTDEACRGGEAEFKMHPPLRPRADVEGCLQGVLDGTIDILVTDHAPHTPEEKARGMLEAPAGIIGLETSLALFADALVWPGHIGWMKLVELMSTAPARHFGLPGGTLEPGNAADVTIIDPQHEWTIDPECFESLGRNCPFRGRRVRGRAICTIVEGRVCYDRDGVRQRS